MALVDAIVKNDPTGVIKDMRTKAHKAHLHAIRKSLAVMERYHKRKWFVTGTKNRKGKLKDKATRPKRLTSRTGHLMLSYTRSIDKRNLIGVYGSDKAYSRIHEFGGPAGAPGKRFEMPKRPGLEVTSKATGHAIEAIFAKLLKKEGL